MKKVDLNIRVDDLILGGIVNDDNIPLQVQKIGDRWSAIKVIAQSDTVNGVQKMIDDLKSTKKEGWEVSKKHIEIALDMYQQKPDARTGQPEGKDMPEQRKIYSILEALDGMKKGILELDDDMLEYVKKIFNETGWTGGTKILVRVSDRFEKATIEKKSG